MKNLSNILAITIALILLTACGRKAQETHEDVTSGKDPDELSQTITSLTSGQIRNVGIEYGTVEMKELTATIRANGNLKVPNDKKASATSLFGGTVTAIHVQVGDQVKKGQVVATIANPEFVQLQQEYLTVIGQLTMAGQEYNRQKELFDNNAGTRRNLQNAESELRTLKTKKAALYQQLQLMGINPSALSNASLKTGLPVRAPISGTVSNVIARIGGYADVSAAVAEIVDNSSLHLDLHVFERDLPSLKVGQVIHFTLTNNPANEYDAEVFSIGAAFENESKTIPVHARVQGNKKGLIDGMNITSVVSLNQVLKPAVPDEAVVNADGKSYIFIVVSKSAGQHPSENDNINGNGPEQSISFEKIEVVTGVSNMGYKAIMPVKSLPRNAQVVIKGAYFINAKLSNSGEHEEH